MRKEQSEIRAGHCSAAPATGVPGALSKVKLGGVLDGVLQPPWNIP